MPRWVIWVIIACSALGTGAIELRLAPPIVIMLTTFSVVVAAIVYAELRQPRE